MEVILERSFYYDNKTELNKDWRILWYPNPKKNHSRYIGYDRFKEMLFDVKKPLVEKEETLNNILIRLEECMGDDLEVKIRGRLRFKMVRV